MYFTLQGGHILKIGILSDIHGNLRAFEATVCSLRSHNVDKIFCLGDMIGYFHQSLDVVDRLIESDIECILGNHEAYLLGYLPCIIDKWQVYFLDEVKNRMPTNQLEWLSALPKSIEVDIDGKKLGFFHGSPWNPLEEYIYPDSKKLNDFAGLEYDYIFLGHTHYPMLKQAGNVKMINPGSCGLPRTGDVRASAVVVDFEEKTVLFIKESYDIHSTIHEAKSAGVHIEVIKKLEEGANNDQK